MSGEGGGTCGARRGATRRALLLTLLTLVLVLQLLQLLLLLVLLLLAPPLLHVKLKDGHRVNTRRFFSFFFFGLVFRDAHPEVLVQLLLGEGGAGLRGERGEEEGRVQRGEERRVRAGAQTPLSDPEVHGKGGHTRHRRCHGGVWEKTRRGRKKNKWSARRQLATSRPGVAIYTTVAGGKPYLWKHNGRV